MEIFKNSDLIIWLVDLSSRGWNNRLKEDLKRLGENVIMLTGNKIDLVEDYKKAISDYPKMLPVSCLTGVGLKKLKSELTKRINKKMPDLTSGMVVTSARHQRKLKEAVKHIKAAREKIDKEESPEFTAFDLNQAAKDLDEITGKVYNEQILEEIFSRFCIGK